MLSSILLLLLSLSISGSLVIILISVICRLLNKKLSPQWQYYIWIAAIARLLLPFSPAENLMGHLHSSNNTNSYADAFHSSTEINSNQDAFHSLNLPDSSSEKSESQNKINTMHSFKTRLKRILRKLYEYRQYLCIFWLVTAMLVLMRKITLYQDFKRFIQAGSAPIDDIDCLETLSNIESMLGIQKPIELWSSQLIASPILIGFCHPCIVLPQENYRSEKDSLSKAFYYTILHELIHYKRRDMYYKWLVQMTLCIQWFNPFVYIMARQTSRLCELSCDEAVTARLKSDSEQKEYAATLLAAMSTKPYTYKEQTASLTLTENKKLLKERMEFIMRKKETAMSKKLLTAVLTAAIAAASIYSGSLPADTSAAKNGTEQIEGSSQSNTPESSISENTTDIFPEKDTLKSIKSTNSKDNEITAEQADEMALALTNKIWVWEWVEFFVPYMSKEGAKQLVSASKHAEWAGAVDQTTGKKLKFTKKQINRARKKAPSEPLTCRDIDSHALMIMQSNGDWDCISFMLPYMSKKGIQAVTRCYNSKHGDEKKRAADYY